MKGFVLSQLISYLENTYDELTVENLLNSIGAPDGGVYSPMVDYPDTTLRDLVERAAPLIDIPQKKLTRLMGVWNFSELVSINLSWIEESSNTFELLKNHDEYLNEFVELSFPGFVAPTFRCVEISPDMLEANFSSTFLLADIAEGIIDAMIIFKKERISVEAIKTAECDECSRQFILRRRPAKIN